MTVQVYKQKRQLLITERDPRIGSVDGAKALPASTGYSYMVPHNTATVKVLRNLGVDAPSPVLSYYRWPGKYPPFSGQRLMVEFLTMHRRCFNLSEPGAGKTAAALWAADWLMQEGLVHKVLIVAPLSALEKTWMQDIFDVLMHRRAVVVHGSLRERQLSLEVDADFYVINHDGLTVKGVAEAIRKNPRIDLVIMDEGHEFRNSLTDKYKSFGKMLRDDMRVWWMTGTPCPRSPTDVWSQCKVVAPERVPKFFTAFKRAVMVPLSQFKWEARSNAYELAYQAMQPAIRLWKRDYIDLPPMLPPRNIACELSGEQKMAMRQMMKEFRADVGTEVTAVNAADRINKLRQILCGSVKLPDGKYQDLPHKSRTELLLSAVREASAKVIVIVPFKGIIHSIEKDLKAAGYSVGVLNGDVPIKQRNAVITAFKSGPDPHILLCHPQVMNYSINLVEADTLIFYAPIYSNAQYLQVIERFNRAGQKNVMRVLRIGGHEIEWDIYSTVDEQGVTQNSVLELYRKVLNEW